MSTSIWGVFGQLASRANRSFPFPASQKVTADTHEPA
jgi:hypothetical protein